MKEKAIKEEAGILFTKDELNVIVNIFCMVDPANIKESKPELVALRMTVAVNSDSFSDLHDKLHMILDQ